MFASFRKALSINIPRQAGESVRLFALGNYSQVRWGYLRSDSGGYFYPLAKAGEAPAQSVQGHIQTSNSANSIIRSVRVSQVSTLGGGA